MRFLRLIAVFVLALSAASCGDSTDIISSSADGAVISNVVARGADGEARELSDLEELVDAAWGSGRFGSHRGHSEIENVLEAFLGINHRQMHVLMDRGQNLAAICKTFGFNPEHLVESLTASFAPYIESAAENGVIPAGEVPVWRERVRDAFHRRVHWEG